MCLPVLEREGAGGHFRDQLWLLQFSQIERGNSLNIVIENGGYVGSLC